VKFLIDQGLPRSTVQHLQDVGVEAEHVGDLDLARATDKTIIDEGKNREAVVVTLDSDFLALLALLALLASFPIFVPSSSFVVYLRFHLAEA
jgi:predicted nuclease of predicted toxin-antitoxin system